MDFYCLGYHGLLISNNHEYVWNFGAICVFPSRGIVYQVYAINIKIHQ